MSLHIENPRKRRKARIVDAALSILTAPTLRGVRKRRGDDLSKAKLKKILLIQPHHLGDFIMFTPALRALRERLPDAELVLLAGSWSEPLIRGNPFPDRVIYHDCRWWTKIRPGETPSLLGYLASYWELLKKLRQERFDLAIDFLGDLRNILLFAHLPGAKYRLSFQRSGGAYMLTHSKPYDADEHEAARRLRLLKILNVNQEPSPPDVFVPDKERRAASALMEERELKPGGFILIHPGARLAIKRWPLERFIALARRLAKDSSRKVVFIGDASDEKRLKGTRLESEGIANLCGALDILTLKALMEKAAVFIGNNSAGMHLASAAGLPIVAIFGPGAISRTAPLGVPRRIIQKDFDCSPCLELECDRSDDRHGACLKAISVEEVFREASGFLKELAKAPEKQAP